MRRLLPFREALVLKPRLPDRSSLRSYPINPNVALFDERHLSTIVIPHKVRDLHYAVNLRPSRISRYDPHEPRASALEGPPTRLKRRARQNSNRTTQKSCGTDTPVRRR